MKFSIYNWRNLKISHIFWKKLSYTFIVESRFEIESHFFFQGAHIQVRIIIYVTIFFRGTRTFSVFFFYFFLKR